MFKYAPFWCFVGVLLLPPPNGNYRLMVWKPLEHRADSALLLLNSAVNGSTWKSTRFYQPWRYYLFQYTTTTTYFHQIASFCGGISNMARRIAPDSTVWPLSFLRLVPPQSVFAKYSLQSLQAGFSNLIRPSSCPFEWCAATVVSCWLVLSSAEFWARRCTLEEATSSGVLCATKRVFRTKH